MKINDLWAKLFWDQSGSGYTASTPQATVVELQPVEGPMSVISQCDFASNG